MDVPLYELGDGLAIAEGAPRSVTPFEVPITVTGYSSTVDQTDSTPFITASNTRVRPGIIALSRDLLREFTPGAPFGYGDEVLIHGVGRFTVEDTMNRRYRKRADIWFSSRRDAIHWGRQHRIIAPAGEAELAEAIGGQSPHVPLFEAALAD